MFGNERDIEIPQLLAFVRELRPSSLLDVGAHGTASTYAPMIRGNADGLASYEGIDMIPDDATAAILDRYIVGDFINESERIKPCDVVTCVSVIEHVGVKGSSVARPDVLRRLLFQYLLEIATCGVFLSAPFGQELTCDGEYSNITPRALRAFEALADAYGFGTRARFWWSEEPQGGPQTWREVRPHVARTAPIASAPFCVLTLECVK